MSRSAADATRFTATGPYANSKAGATRPYKLPDFMKPENKSKSTPQDAPQKQPTGSDGKPETPKEKVERLRAQVRAARMAQESWLDRMIASTRGTVNKVHKGMVYTLLAATGVCGVLTIYSVVSLTLYNRRQRKLWIEGEVESLKQARIAYAAGTATAEQIEIVKNEEIGEIFKQKKEGEKAQRPWNQAKRYLAEKLNMEDAGAAAVSVTGTTAAAVEDGQTGGGVMDAVNAKRAIDAAASNTQTPALGQLDVMAENAERAAKQSTRGWVSWLTGR